MKTKQALYSFLKCSLALRAFITLLFISVSTMANSQNMTLVAVGNQTGTPAEMKMTELRSILMGEKQRWQNGKRILIALMKTNTPIGRTTSAKLYDMSGDQLNKFWLALVFQGKAPAPTFFNTESDLENFVASNPGAIGILDKPIADPGIKSIIIDGQKTF